MPVVLALLALLALAAPAEAHSRSSFVLGLSLPLYFGPSAYAYPPPAYYPPVYYPAPAVAPGCREVWGRGDETGQLYRGLACRRPDGSWQITPQ